MINLGGNSRGMGGCTYTSYRFDLIIALMELVNYNLISAYSSNLR
jgi:hypothetical protein